MAQLAVNLLGMHFPNPILAGAGPQTDSAADILAAMAGGAGGVVARTVRAGEVVPPPEPSIVPYGKDGLLTCQKGSARPLADWLSVQYPAALAGANVPLIMSLTGMPDEVRTIAPRLVAAGARALEFATGALPWATAVEALQVLRKTVTVPVIAKLSLAHGEDLADRALEIESFVDAYTCIAAFGPVLDLDPENGGRPRLGSPNGYGALSGTPMHPIAVRAVFEVARAVRQPVIAAGGAAAAADVVEFLQAGACLVQVTTAALLRTPAIYGALAQGLAAWLDAKGYPDVAEVTGLYLRRFGHGQRVVLTSEEAPMLEEELCIKCGICDDVCYYDAIDAPRKRLPVIFAERCFECGLCVSACPTNALSFRPRSQVTMLSRN